MDKDTSQSIVFFNSQSQIYKKITQDFIDANPTLPSEMQCAESITEAISTEIELQNSLRPKQGKLKMPQDISPLSISMLIVARDDVALIAPGDKSLQNKKTDFSITERLNFPIGIYQECEKNEGVWEVTNTPIGAFGALVKKYKPNATRNELKEIFDYVKENARVVRKCVVPYLTAVKNGIVDVKNKTLIPFSREYVFTSKIKTNLDFSATNPIISIDEDGSTWDFDSWTSSLGDADFVNSLLEVVQASCLPFAPRNKMVLFYSVTGNNGKGTICQLIRNLIGEDEAVSISLEKFSERFGLSSLPHAFAIITDENNVNSFTKGLANLKAVITGDKVSVERKHENTYDYSFNGLVLQCVNDLPRVDDKTGSFIRRLHIIPFANCFTGAEKKYIKDKLIHRDDVLEYLLKKVLIDMPYRDSFTETEATKSALAEYKIYTNTVHSFLEEILPRCRWDLLPATDFLYEMYKEWYRKTVPSGKVIGRNDFIDGVKEYVNSSFKENPSFEWEWTDNTRSNGYINTGVWEELLLEYKITTMISEQQIYCRLAYPDRVKLKYSGLKRRNNVSNSKTQTSKINEREE